MDVSDQARQDRDVLCWLLGVNIRAHKRADQLERRLQEIIAEENNPIGGVNYDPLPRGSGEGIGAASLVFKLADIEDRIIRQRDAIRQAIMQVMDILDYLPQDSLERTVCEQRYIDRQHIEAIADQIPMSRSGVYKVHDKAISILMEIEDVQKIIADNRLAYLNYSIGKQLARARRESAQKNQSGV